MVIAAIFCTAVSVNAQIQVQETFTNDLIIIGNISSGAANNVLGAIGGNPSTKQAEHRLYCRIFKDKVTYGILVDTQNRYDDDFEFALGPDIDKSRQSVEMLLKFMKESDKNTSMVVTDEDNRTIQITLKSRTVIHLQVLESDRTTIIVNNVYLNQANLQRTIKLLNKKAEEKVAAALLKNKK